MTALPIDPNREEVYPIVDDPEQAMNRMADEALQNDGSYDQKMSVDLQKNRLGRPAIRYKDRIMEADVYPAPDGKGVLVHIHCPRCEHVNVIRSDRKNVEYDRRTNLLSVEPYQCCWELGDRDNERMAFGVGLCRLRLAIDKNVAKDA
jgi:hypothetical protein